MVSHRLPKWQWWSRLCWILLSSLCHMGSSELAMPCVFTAGKGWNGAAMTENLLVLFWLQENLTIAFRSVSRVKAWGPKAILTSPSTQACDASRVASGICWKKSTWNLSQYRPCLSRPSILSCPTDPSLIDIDVSARICSKGTGTKEGRRTLMTSRTWLLKSCDFLATLPTLRVA